MARTVYPFELQDEDFTWLLNNYLEQNPNSFALEVDGCPVILLSECNITNEDESCGKNCENQIASHNAEEDELMCLLRKPNT